MRKVKVQNVDFGKGMPKIAIPLTGERLPALYEELEYVRALPADLLEWRADYYLGNLLEVPSLLRENVGEKPLLCTVRTRKEGGQAALTPEEYEAAVTALIGTGKFDLVDLELSCGQERLLRLLRLAHEGEMAVVISKHDFEKTPPEHEIFCTLLEMERLGAELPKYAVMPQNVRDVLALLSATERASREFGPVVTMSMGALGKISRASGAYFGSCITFAAGKNASAPGQIIAEDLKAVLQDLDPAR